MQEFRKMLGSLSSLSFRSYRRYAWQLLRSWHGVAIVSATMLFVSTSAAFAATELPARAEQSQQTGLMPNFNLDLALYYSDQLGVPGGGKMVSGVAPVVSAVKPGSRSLGVERARIGVTWTNARKSGVSLVLRPEYASLPGSGAGSLTQTYREIDHRAGDVYSPAPSVKLLDAYAISLSAFESFAVEIGVFETLIPRRSAYQEVLDFGLSVSLPRKFSGAKMDWRWSADAPVPGVETSGNAFQLLVVGLHGPDDRGDAFKVGEKTYDEAPASVDPYAGGATYVGWTLSPQVSAGLLAGFGDHGFEQSAGSSLVASNGKRSETFGGFGATMKVGQDRKTHIGLDLRMARDAFVLNEGKAAPLSQRSMSITFASLLAGVSKNDPHRGMFLLAGLHAGASQRHLPADASEILNVEGYQTDLGMLYALDRDLDIALMGAWEKRSVKNPGGQRTGGFGQNDPRNSIQRLGLRLNYVISGS